MAYTVRADEKEENSINQAKLALGEKSATKAMIKACELLPSHLEKIELLERELESVKREHKDLKALLRSKYDIENKIGVLINANFSG